MRNLFKTLSYAALLILVLSISMAILSSKTYDPKTGKDVSDFYILEKGGFYDDLDFLKENALFKALSIGKVADQDTPSVVQKYSRAPALKKTIDSSLLTLGMTAFSSEKVPGSNVVLTSYKAEKPAVILSEDAKQAEEFNQTVGQSVGISLTGNDITYLKQASASERLKQVNQVGAILGIKLTPEMYIQFNENDKANRVKQVIDLGQKFDMPISREWAEKFVEGYSKFPGVPPVN
ncbi:MAG: hypothetical protein V2A63_00375 [Patescibacteria group bacterium]